MIAYRKTSIKRWYRGRPASGGKTTFARKLLSDDKGYLNWDIPPHRDAILRREYPPVPLIVFDEIHKYRNWRNYLKGFYDQFGKTKKILVTGSARLDYYRYGGDSACRGGIISTAYSRLR